MTINRKLIINNDKLLTVRYFCGLKQTQIIWTQGNQLQVETGGDLTVGTVIGQMYRLHIRK